MQQINLHAAWIGILLGAVTGGFQGMFFHNDNWLGGYASWPRRMTRLGHISLFGLAFINLAYALSLRHLGVQRANPWTSGLFVLAAVTMPLVCYLSAYRKSFRHLFPIPVVSVLAAAGIFIVTRLLT